jgi:cytochrome b involved in lipid metabolism
MNEWLAHARTLPTWLPPALFALTDDGLRKRLVGAGEEASNAREPGVYTWKEVAKHCTEESVWVSVEGKVLDLTNWLNSHPGGKDMLLLMAGRDATAAFQSYHPFTDKPRKIIKKVRHPCLARPSLLAFLLGVHFSETILPIFLLYSV